MSAWDEYQKALRSTTNTGGASYSNYRDPFDAYQRYRSELLGREYEETEKERERREKERLRREKREAKNDPFAEAERRDQEAIATWGDDALGANKPQGIMAREMQANRDAIIRQEEAELRARTATQPSASGYITAGGATNAIDFLKLQTPAAEDQKDERDETLARTQRTVDRIKAETEQDGLLYKLGIKKAQPVSKQEDDIKEKPVSEEVKALDKQLLQQLDQKINTGRTLTPDEEVQYSEAKLRQYYKQYPGLEKLITEHNDYHSASNAFLNSDEDDFKKSMYMTKTLAKTQDVENRIKDLTGWNDDELAGVLKYANRAQDRKDTEADTKKYEIDTNAPLRGQAQKGYENTKYSLRNNGGVENFIAWGEQFSNKPKGFGTNTDNGIYRKINNSNAAVTETTKAIQKDAEKIVSKALGEEKGKLAGDLAGRVYQSGVSALDSELTKIPGLIVTAATGSKAAGDIVGLAPYYFKSFNNDYMEARNKGATDEEAWGRGVMGGLIEVGTELVGMDNFVNNLMGEKASKSFVKNLIKQMASEGLEEGVSDILNEFVDSVIYSKDPQVKSSFQQRIEETGSVKGAVGDFLIDMGLDTVFGALSAGPGSATTMGLGARGYRNMAQNISQSAAQASQNIQGDSTYEQSVKAQMEQYEKNPTRYVADNLAENTEDDRKRKAEVMKLAKKEAEGGKLTAGERLFIQEAIADSQASEEQAIQEGKTNERREEEIRTNAQVPVQYRDKVSNLTEDEARERLAEAAKAGDTEAFIDAMRMTRNSSYEEVAKNAEQIIADYSGMAQSHGISKEDIGNSILTEKKAYIAALMGEELDTDAMTPKVKMAYNDGKMDAINQKVRTTIDTTDSLKTDVTTKEGNTVKLDGVFTSDGIQTSDGVVTMDNLDLDENKATNKAYAFADNYESINVKNNFLNNIKDGQNIENYNRDYGRVYDSALAGLSLESVKKESLNELDEDQIENIYETAVVERQARAAESFAEVFNGTKGKGQGKAFNESSSTDPKMLKIASMLARGTKYDIHLVDEVPQNKSAKGAFVKNENAIYVRADDFMRTLGHEFSHYIETYNKGEYDSLRNAVANFAASKMGSDAFMRAVDQYRGLYKTKGKQQLSASDISGEMFNDIVPIILESKQGSKALAKYLAENYGAEEAKSFGEKIKDVIDNLAGTIKNYLSNADHNTEYAKEMRKYADELGQYADQFIKALDGAIQNYNKGQFKGEDAGDETRFSMAENVRNHDYSYDTLIKKDPIPVFNVNDYDFEGIKYDGKVNSKDVIEIARKNIAKYNEGNKLGDNALENDEIGVAHTGKDPIDHTLVRKTQNRIDACTYLPVYFKNAIVLNEADGLRKGATKSYVMFGLYNDGENRSLVRMLVNHYDNSNAPIINSLYALNLKKEEAASNDAPGFNQLTSSKVSIAQLLEIVKKYFPNDLSADVAEHLGYTRGETDVKGLRYSLEENSDKQALINSTMTMAECKDMIERAFVLSGTKEWSEGEIRTAQQWLDEYGIDSVVLQIENEYTLQQKFLNKIPAVVDGDVYVEDIIQAYVNGTLTGGNRVKKETKRLDVSKENGVKDNRFYSPKEINNVKELYDVAKQRVTKANEKEVYGARAAILLFAHNKGAAEQLGITNAELNKLLRKWGNYSAGARDVSERINRDASLENRWTGIENSNWLSRHSVNLDELSRLVGNIEGDPSSTQRNYIARAMLALDTHIDYTGLNFKFMSTVDEDRSSVNGTYNNYDRTIRVKYNAPNTVAHEMGHFLDYLWGRDLGNSSRPISEIAASNKEYDDPMVAQWMTNLNNFFESLEDVSSRYSEYAMDRKEVFARFVDHFVRWTEKLATGYSYDKGLSYGDDFTNAQCIEFAKLLQEKSAINMYEQKETSDVKLSVSMDAEDSEGRHLSEGQQKYFNNSQALDEEGRLLELYHGTEAQAFSVFNTPGIWVTPDKKLATDYAGEWNNWRNETEGYGKIKYETNGMEPEVYGDKYLRMYKVYANVTNPVSLGELNRTLPDDYAGLEMDNFGIKTEEQFDRLYALVQEHLGDKIWQLTETKEFIDLMKELGYDGMFATENGHKTICVFDSSQLKNINNLNPTSSDDIRYALGLEDDWVDFAEELGVNTTTSEEKAVDILAKGMEAMKNKEVDVPKLRSLALKLRKEYGSTYNVNKLTEDLEKAFAYMQTEDHVDYPTMMGILRDIARPVIEEAGEKVGEEDYKNFIDYFKGKKIKLTQVQKDNVASAFGSYGKFRNAVMPITISDNGDYTLDQIWEEIAQASGNMVDLSATEGNQPQELYDALQALKPYVSNDFGGDTEDLAKDLAMRIVEEYIEGEASKQMHKQLTDYRDKLKKDYQKRLDNLKGRANAEVLARNKKRAEEAKERAEVRDLKTKIKQNANKLYTWAINPKEGKSVPTKFMMPVMQFLQAIDFVDPVVTVSEDGKYHIRLFDRVDYVDGKKKFIYKDLVGDTREDVLKQFNEAVGRGEGSKEQRSWTDKMQGIRDIYNRVLADKEFEDASLDFLMQTLDGVGLAEDFDELLSKHKGQADMNHLNSEELTLINNILKNIFKAVNQQNKAYSQPSVDLVNLAQSTMQDAEGKEVTTGNGFLGGLHKMFRLDNVTPRTFFKLLGQRGHEIYDFLREGLNRQIKVLKNASDFMKGVMEGIDTSKWTGRKATVHDFALSNGNVQMTDDQIMGLYLTIRDSDGMDRIRKEGVRIDDINTKSHKIKRQAPIKLNERDIKQIESVLTPEQIEVAKKMQQYMANDLGALGNETSEKLYGYRKFTNPTYYPRTVDKGTVATTNASEDVPRVNGIERAGMTKERKKEATNPLVIRGIFDVFADHVAQMAAYNGYAAPVKDTLRWMNYRERSDEGGNYTKWAINKLVNNDNGVGYITNLLFDINQANKSRYIGNFTDALIGRYKAAAVGANLRVVAQQPTAYFRALNMISPKYLLSVNPATAIKNIKRSQEQSPISWWKSKGYYETNLGQPIKEIVTGIASPTEKVKDFMMAPAGWADDFTWGFLYTAVENEQRALLKGQDITPEQFREAVNKRFDEVVDNTQVVDSTLHRSQYMRSTDRLNKIQTAFMAEPTKSYNMLLEAALEDRAEGKTMKRTARAATAFLLSALATSAAAAVVDALRKSHDDDDWWEVWLDNLQENIADNINPFNLLPIVKDVSAGIYNLIQELSTGKTNYNKNSNRFDLEAISSLMDAASTIIKWYQGEGNKTGYGKYMALARPFSQITGIPLYNLSKDLVALYNAFFNNLETTINSGSTKNNEIKKGFVSDVNKERSENTLDEGIVEALNSGVSIYDLKGAVKSEYKNKYFDAYSEGNMEEAQAIAERAARAYARMGMSDEDIDEEINAWQEETITYSLLDKAIAKGEGIEEEIRHVQEGKDDDKIIKHIMDRYSETIAYEDTHETESDWRGNVEKALQAIDPTLTFDTANEEAMQQKAEKEAEQAAQAEKKGYKEEFFASVDAKNGTAGRKALDGLKAMGVDAKGAKTMVSTQYHDAWKEAKTPAEKQKAKADWMSAYKLVCNYYGVEYKDLEKTWSEWEKDQENK